MVTYLVTAIFQERTLRFSPREAFSDQFPLKRNSFFDSEELVVLSKSGLTLFIHHENEFDHRPVSG